MASDTYQPLPKPEPPRFVEVRVLPAAPPGGAREQLIAVDAIRMLWRRDGYSEHTCIELKDGLVLIIDLNYTNVVLKLKEMGHTFGDLIRQEKQE